VLVPGAGLLDREGSRPADNDPAMGPSDHALPTGSGRQDAPVVLDARVVTGTGGGPDKTILNSPRFLAAHGYRNICAYMHPPDDPGFVQLRERAEVCGAPLLSVPDRGPLDARVAAQLLRICRRERVAIWHGHDYKSNLLGLILRPFWPMRLVTTVHGWGVHTRRTPLYYGIDRLCLPRYERVICVSENLYDDCLAFGVPGRSCTLVENGIDVREFTRTVRTSEAKERLGTPPGRLVIGAVGRLSAEKGYDHLVRAADRLISAGLDVELWIAGDGDERSNLQSLVTGLGRADRIRLLGYRTDTGELYQAMDVFALSSLREGLPNVLLEAMALEVPVIATRIAGVPRLMQDGGNGLLVAPGSVDELTDGLTRLLRDPGLRDRLRLAGRRVVEARYSFEARMGKIRSIYDGLLAGSGRPARP
jgi:glycosyltransferase involved in cell wall biosynthesis